jgi:diaminopimelate epimerase
MSTLRLSKFVATGNDFIFLDGREAAKSERPVLATKLCDRHFGVGADGIVFVDEISGPRLQWDFYNNDGSVAEMCGNASRCMGRWAERELGWREVLFDTLAGPVRVEVRGETVVSHLDYLSLGFVEVDVELKGQIYSGVLVDTGVPHVVFSTRDLIRARTEVELVKSFRFHPRAGEKGANVTLLQKQAVTGFASVTFERGVEDFTLSCGTGVLAAAAVGLRDSGAVELETEVTTPGGRLHAGFGPGFKGASLEGAAAFVFATELDKELWR